MKQNKTKVHSIDGSNARDVRLNSRNLGRSNHSGPRPIERYMGDHLFPELRDISDRLTYGFPQSTIKLKIKAAMAETGPPIIINNPQGHIT